MKLRRTVQSTVTAIGVRKFVLFGSWDGADRPLTRITPSTAVKLAAGAWISFSRKVDVVTPQLGPRHHHPLTPPQPVPGEPPF
jgi:hypothetical protein